MRAISTFRRDDGMSTRPCRAIVALRIRDSMSAIGSVINLEPCDFVDLWARPSRSGVPKPATGSSVDARPEGLAYQLLFVTPAMSPSSASLRKHRRHSANFRMYARGRPQRLQRLRSRILYFGVLTSFAIFAV